MDDYEKDFDAEKEKLVKNNETKAKLMEYSKQLVSLGALQQSIVRNIQKELQSDL